jgi:hypothetical protein
MDPRKPARQSVAQHHDAIAAAISSGVKVVQAPD